MEQVRLLPGPPMEYKVISAETTHGLEIELNIAAAEDWRVISTNFVPGPYWN